MTINKPHDPVLRAATQPVEQQDNVPDGWRSRFLKLMGEIQSELDGSDDDPIPSELWSLWRELLDTAPQPAEQKHSAGDSLASVPDEVFAAEFAAWWDEHGQFCRAGGGNYERSFAFEAWRHLYPQLMKLQMAAEEQQPIIPNERGKNRYGLDMSYFRNLFNRELNRPLVNFKPSELARVLARASRTADPKVMHETEFQIAEQKPAPDVTHLVEALECFVEWYEQVNLRNEPRFQFYDKAKKALAAHRKRDSQPCPAIQEGYAGATVWIGDKRVTQVVTEGSLKHESEPGMAITHAAQACLDLLAAAHRKGEEL